MTTFPNPEAGEFTHRINAVPAVGRRIVYIDHAQQERGALVVAAGAHAAYRGIGDDVRLKAADGRLWVPSDVMVSWRYA